MNNPKQSGTTKNNKGKIEKNKKVKAGDCIFPFKYKHIEHNGCYKTELGEICATEINPKTRTLTKYGYCEVKPTTEKKSPKKVNHKTLRKKVNHKTLRKKLILKSAKEKPHNKTMKRATKLKLVAKKTATPHKKRLNEDFIKIMSELQEIMMRQGEPFRAKAYREASEAIMMYNGDITDPKQLEGVRHIGKTIMSKFIEYMDTGTLAILERERTNPLNVLTKVYGVGPKKAKEFISKGITTLDDLRKNEDLLTDGMKIGLKYYDDIEDRIPRSEIDDYNTLLSDVFEKTTPPGSEFQIVGSYRRGAKTSGDIDMIITNKDNNRATMYMFIDKLIADKIVIEVLSRGKTKCLAVARLPGKQSSCKQSSGKQSSCKRARRVDFMYAPPTEFAFATLYFTGSKAFNTVQRQRALDLGYTMNEHGFHKMVDKMKGEKVSGVFPDEKAIFDFLGMEYREPNQRIDGRSVTLTEKKQAAQTEKKQAAQAEQKQTEKKPAARKKLTLKKLPHVKKNNIGRFKTEGLSVLKQLTEAELSTMIRNANDAYYCNNKQILTDNEYDILREFTVEKYPENTAASEGHTMCKVVKGKVELPFEMWSMDKIKPDTKALEKWMKTYKGPYVLSCKLDGVSGLYSTMGGTPKLYTRGNGKVGQDVSHLISFLGLPTTTDIVIRGEFIVEKAVFQKKYAGTFANPRNFVGGIVNQKKVDSDKFADLDFVAYEVILPELTPSQQMSYLEETLGVNTVRNVTEKTVTNELLSELLVAWRDDYKYEIDGVICINDEIYPRTTGNPDHAFAFKMVLSDQIAEAKVLDVIWTASKDGYLKPRVQIDPVVLTGAKIEYATGFNGKFIEENNIGVGAVIKLIRSGDVIPHIVSVIQPAEHPLMPSEPYVWNDTHVDIMLKDKASNSIVKEKTIAGFFKILGVDGLGPGNVKRLIKSGFDTVPKIIDMTKNDFLTVEGFKETMSVKIHDGIKSKIENASLSELMHATNLFGRGFGRRRFEAILKQVPDILVSKKSDAEKRQQLVAVEGMAQKSADKFMAHSQTFVDWAKAAGLEKRLHYKPTKLSADPMHPLFGKKWLMTGFRDKELMEKLNNVGAEQQSAVSKKTFMVIVKDKDEDTGKAEEARKLGIPVLTPDEIALKYTL